MALSIDKHRSSLYLADMEIHSMYKKELACLYFKNSTPNSATIQLSRWIVRNQKLHDELTLLGYHKCQRSFTPRQVELIFYYLGEP